jgi:serine/threonine-protein kinase HipA
MRVGDQEADSTLDNALSQTALFSLKRNEAIQEIRTVVRAVDGWKQHFMKCGVSRGDIDSYAEQIDRPFLRDQRAAYSGGRAR